VNRKGAVTAMKSKWVPVVAADKCTGCGRCVEVCGVKCLEIAEGIAVLPRPDACGSEEHCITECRDDAIHMAWVPMGGNEAVGVWR
jgi:MinD superfamily P-loop ATPase